MLPLALAYGGLAQLLAGMWEFRTGNTYGAVLFSSFGAFWLSVYILLKLPVGAFNEAGFSLYLYAWAIFTAIMFLGSLRTNAVLALAILLLLVTFLLLAIGHASLVGSTDLTNSTIKFGGYVGIVTRAERLVPGGGGRPRGDVRPGGAARIPAEPLVGGLAAIGARRMTVAY